MVISSGCVKQAIKSQYESQETTISKLATSLRGLRTQYQNGVVRVVMKEGTSADSLSATGVVSFYYAQYILASSVNNSNLVATNNREALGNTWKVTEEEGEDAFKIVTLKMDEADLIDGLKYGLLGVKTGEECYILFSGKYGFGKSASGTIPARSGLVYHIWVDSISNE